MEHIPVLLQETIKYLNPKKGETIIDGTLGGGGHAKAFCKNLGKKGTFIGFDRDEKTFDHAKLLLEPFPCKIKFFHANFSEMKKKLLEENITKAHKIFFDLGYSSFQINSDKRGFSFQKDGPLDMRYSGESLVTAYDVVNTWSEKTLADILYGFGEERYARRIARGIVRTREGRPIKSTQELAHVIERSVPYFYRHRKLHYATKSFQAIRIAVNEELESLKKALPVAFSLLTESGRMGVITFHSLEDRIVKSFFRDLSNKKMGKILTKKPIVPKEEEIRENPRARSAKLRVLEKINI